MKMICAVLHISDIHQSQIRQNSDTLLGKHLFRVWSVTYRPVLISVLTEVRGRLWLRFSTTDHIQH